MRDKKHHSIRKRLGSLLLTAVMLLSLLPATVLAASGTTLYLKPNSNWTQANARFAAYFFEGSSNTWADMTDEDGDGYYEVTAPEGYSNVIFCRMNPGTMENRWNDSSDTDATKPIWNQTADLTVPSDDTNCYTVADGTWDNGGGTWSSYTPSSGDGGDNAPETTYIIAGDNVTLFGTAWDVSNTANQMTLNSETGLYEKAYADVAAGTYLFKVTDGTWTNCWGGTAADGNYEFTVSAACDVIITFDADEKKITVSGDGLEQKPDGLQIDAVYAVGNGSGNWLSGANWDPAAVANQMTETSDDIYEITYKAVSKGTNYQVKFAADGSWAVNWGGVYSASGTVADAAFNSSNNITFDVVYDSADVTLKLDLSSFDYSAKTGAKFTITVTESAKYYVAGSIDLCGSEWSAADANNLMSYDGTSKLYQKVYTNVAKGEYELKVTDGTWDHSWGDNGQNYELTVSAASDVTVTFNERTGVVAVSVKEIPADGTKVTIHFLKPGDWGTPLNAYIWTGGGAALTGYEAYNIWPGKAITDTDADSDGWYDLVVSTEEPTAFNFIFNNNGDQHKTADLTTGTVTGDTELWVVDNTVYTVKPKYNAVIHFQKPDDWAGTINAYAWIGSELLLDAWPGTAATANTDNAGWYDASVSDLNDNAGFNFILNDGSKQTVDLTSGTLNFNTELWVTITGMSDSKYAADVDTTAPDGWFDAARTAHVPGTFPGPSWDAASNQMTYDSDLGLYVYTFEDVIPGTYYYKIALNGSWNENYGANGAANGADIAVAVPATQDVTIWYNDESHRTLCSVYYNIDAVVALSGTGVPENTKLTDPDLTGLYSVTVNLSAGTYSDLKLTCTGYDTEEVTFPEFELVSGKAVTFYFDPSTGMAYHNGSDVKVETDNIYYDTKDLDYKAPFGAVAVGEEVTFSIDTGTDAMNVALVVKGLPSVPMTKNGEAVDGVQRWTCTTSFASLGEYQYYFAISNGSDMVFYCDDNYNAYFKKGDYGTGTVRDINNIFPYDLVVYEADFETPDWMKNAVIYQIFPDRFYNADTTNDQAQTSARGEVDYEYIANWGTLPENPSLITDPNYPADAWKGDGEWSNEIYGGDLEGITEKIDYLAELGVTVIYLNPVFSSISNHRYDACDYMEIDPILGTLGDFTELVAAAEENGMHIILDGVFNHVSDDSVYFDRYYKFLTADDFDGKIGAYPYWAYVYDYMNDNSGKTQAEAETAAKAYFSENYGVTDYSYTEWFAVENTLTTSVDNIGLRAGKQVYSYEGWWGYDSMPVIYSTNGSEYQTGNWAEAVISGENSVNAYWISKGMDGWRLDVANEVSDETWQNFRDSVKALDSEAVIIGEIWADATHYLMGDMYDSVMNYVFRDAVAGFARGYQINRDNKAENWDNDFTADDATTVLEILRERYPEEAFYAMMNLVGSHDTARILSYLDDVEDDRYQTDVANNFPSYEDTSARAKNLQYVVAFLQFTYAGAPTIYYGDEIGMVGADDPDDRRTFEWDVLEGTSADDLERQELLQWYTDLAEIRADYSALRTGSVEPFSTGNDDVMGFVRRDSADTIIVLANRNSAAQTITLDLDALDVNANRLTDLISGDTTRETTITVPAYSGVILDADKVVWPTANEEEEEEEPADQLPFTDVEGHWGLDAITYVYTNGIMNGVSATEFAPNATLNRAMMATILYRMAGSPAVDAENPFTDVAAGKWYTDAVIWAAENGVVTGYGDGTFGPMDNITREQMAAMLWRYAKFTGVDVSVGEDTNILSYDDVSDVSEYAVPTMQWACGATLITGRTESTLVPRGTANRAEIATLLMRYLENVAK